MPKLLLEALWPKSERIDKDEIHPIVKKDPNLGIDVAQWFWASLESLIVKPKQEASPEKKEVTLAKPEETPELILAQNPNISAATFMNVLKSKGFKIEMPGKEADASSAFPGTQRESDKGKDGNIKFRAAFREAKASEDGIGPTKFQVTLIREGLGNFGSAHYYPSEALKAAVPIFEGKKIYADHPTLEEDQIRPERSVRDILGYFENVHCVEGEGGCQELQGDVKILADKPYEWARALMRSSIEYAKKFPDKDFVGLSINANGEVQEAPIEEVLKSAPEGAKAKLAKALEQGIQTVRVVTAFDDAMSCDLVTEAGAGGRILQMLEADMSKEKSKEEMEKKEMDKKEGDQEAHDDVAQDKALIMDMLKKLGLIADGEGGEEECHQAEEAMKAAMEGGHSKEEAMQMSGHAMKVAKLMHDKKKKDGDEGEKDDAEESKDEKEEESKEKKEDSKESELIKIKGENASLKEKLNAIELEKHLDKTLKESGLRMEVTKKFRDLVGAVKTTKEIDEKFKLFSEGYRGVGGEADEMDFLSVAPEKTQSRSKESGSIDLSDC